MVFVRALLPNGEGIAELLESGVALRRVRNLYPEAFEGVAGLRCLPELVEHLELPRVQELFELHAPQISDLWEDAYKAANAKESEGRIRLGLMMRLEHRSRLLESSEVMEINEAVLRSWSNAQALRFHQILLPGAKCQRNRHVRNLLVCLAFFWSLSEGALTVEQEYAQQILGLFEPLLDALAEARVQLHAA